MRIYEKAAALFCLFSLIAPQALLAQSSDDSFPVKRDESRQTWRNGGEEMLRNAKRLKFKRKKAKNVILFLGDGMGVATVTAARILEGQLKGTSGEENLLSFESFSSVALSRTYSTNQQTSDSAPTMSAIMTGLKTGDGIISLDQTAIGGSFLSSKNAEAVTLLELAEMTGRSTGVISTARLTHATPAACYAHTPERGWESDADIERASREAHEAGYPDIARQLIEFSYGDGVDVALGGGRYNFLPAGTPDPEYGEQQWAARRSDGRNLVEEWVEKYDDAAFVWNSEQFGKIDAAKTKKLLGLFEPSHMQYEYDRKRGGEKEPSLSEMTSTAIDILEKNKKGFFLMVEGGRIDHAHHEGNAFRALTETIEFSNAVRTAASKVDLEETLIIVTADHSHTLTIGGYPARGNNILGLTRDVGPGGTVAEKPSVDANGKPFTTLGYRNGPGTLKDSGRPELEQEMVTAPDYRQESLIPHGSESHAGEDVAIYAEGVNSWMIRGVMEQNWIFYVMRDALRIKDSVIRKAGDAAR